MNKKQQFIKKSKKDEKWRDDLNQVFETLRDGDISTFTAWQTVSDLIENLLQSKLSECWDMAKVEGAEELFSEIDKEYESFKITEAIATVLVRYRNSLTSKQEVYTIEESQKYPGCFNVYKNDSMVTYFAENDNKNYERAKNWVAKQKQEDEP